MSAIGMIAAYTMYQSHMNAIEQVDTFRQSGDMVFVTAFRRDGNVMMSTSVDASDAETLVSILLGAPSADLQGRARFDGSAAWTRKETPSLALWLVNFGDKKIHVIKALREVCPGMGLKEAKEIVESVPCELSTDLVGSGGKEVARILFDAGATVEFR